MSRPIRLKVASPCKADWDQMRGDDAVRFCGICEKNVYQLSNMTAEQVESLLAAPGDAPCVRFYQRHDGTVMTGNCPVGARKVRRKRALVGLGAGMLSAVGVAFAGSPSQPAGRAVIAPPPAQVNPVKVTPPVTMGTPEVDPTPIMGEVAVAPPEPAPEPEPHRPLMGKPALVR